MLKPTLTCACIGVLAATAQAQEKLPDETAPRGPGWTIRFEPSIYFVGPSGKVRLPSTTTKANRTELGDLNLDSPRLEPYGRIIVARDRWRVALAGLAFSTSDRGATALAAGQIGGAPFATGDGLVSDLSYESMNLDVSYRLYRHLEEGVEPGAGRFEAGVDVLGGVRFHHANFDARVNPVIAAAPGVPTSAGADELFAEPYVGGRIELDIARTFGLDVESSIGGFSTGDRSSVTFTIDAGFVYRPIPALGVRIGYHMEVLDLSSGSGAAEFEWRGSMAGLYWGAQLIF
ncbi:MAG: hypothetical protein H6810_07290 [Phycisphaeraceae bacterium]|nr:MAG: hypothetical protein H6810_07290 [Phycisphaeraceae bacterium]